MYLSRQFFGVYDGIKKKGEKRRGGKREEKRRKEKEEREYINILLVDCFVGKLL
jgi:hypothetical protein